MNKLLVIRFSALGDVAMTLPVMRRILNDFPDTEITFLTRRQFAPLFENIERLHVIGADLKNDHKGFSGLLRLKNHILSIQRPDAIIDLHGVIRTLILSFLLRLSGIPGFTVRKDRQIKKRMIRTKQLHPLPHTTERYMDVFCRAGFELPERPFELPAAIFAPAEEKYADDLIAVQKLPCIGFAPFAKHETKTLPTEISENLLEKLQNKYIVFLFGGKEEEEKFSDWKSKFSNIITTDALSLAQQLALISRLKAMISMDSGNMHLAAIQSVPVVSIWGATHPYLGFSGLQTDPAGIVSAEKELACRPCSVFGNKACSNSAEPLACLTNISAASILSALERVVK